MTKFRTKLEQKAHEHPSDMYYRTRRWFMLLAAVLSIWEILGISVGKTDKCEPVAKSFSNLCISVNSPDAIPIILVALLLYFGMRFYLVWEQQSETVKKTHAHRKDYLLSLTLGAIGLGIWSIQALNPEIKVGDYLIGDDESHKLKLVFLLLLLAVCIFNYAIPLFTLLVECLFSPDRKVKVAKWAKGRIEERNRRFLFIQITSTHFPLTNYVLGCIRLPVTTIIKMVVVVFCIYLLSQLGSFPYQTIRI